VTSLADYVRREKQFVSASFFGVAENVWSRLSGAETSTASAGAIPDIWRNMHLTTGPAAVAPYPLFSRYALTVYGRDESMLYAANAEESFHGKLFRP
jgi:hypothetical protein